MALIRITIRDIGQHWHKRIWVFGIPVYHRHDFTKNPANGSVGFNSFPSAPIDIDDIEEDNE